MRLRPTSGDVRRSTKVYRDLLYEPDEHLKRDAEFPPMRAESRRAADDRFAHLNVPDPRDPNGDGGGFAVGRGFGDGATRALRRTLVSAGPGRAGYGLVSARYSLEGAGLISRR
jgi:hypothetical protein